MDRTKPILVYDGDCSFCKLWIQRWKRFTGDSIEYAPYQEAAKDFPHIPLENFRRSVWFIPLNGEAVAGAHAVFRSLEHAPGKAWLYRLYRRFPGFAPFSEAVYRLVASKRDALYKLTILLWGKSLEPSSYLLSRWLFLRGMGVIYSIAFVSLFVQIPGLVGSNGMLPAGMFLDAVHQQAGSDAYRFYPTLAWISSSDQFLRFLCIGGAVCSMMLIAGLLPTISSLLCWMFYVSLTVIGQEFLSFQWDILLLEAGFLAIFFSPLQILPRPSRERPPSGAMVWLVRLLLFKLIFQSGVVKLTAGDQTWWNLSALTYHYWTQPIPNPVSWYIHQMPVWFHKISVLVMFFCELAVPFSVFAARRLRFLGGILLIAFQLLIILTGNYTFFNLLAIVLCISMFDDSALRSLLPGRLTNRFLQHPPIARVAGVRRLALVGFASVVILLDGLHLSGLFIPFGAFPGPALGLLRWTSPFGISNSYGLFRVMTTAREEIIFEGSGDGQRWLAYEFKYKPGDVNRIPPLVAPHQPRLDWQMWFAAFRTYRENPWLVNFAVRLLQGSPAVIDLLEYDPFPESPPRYIRAQLYDYHFTNREEHARTGAYWKREYRGVYLPPISLRRE